MMWPNKTPLYRGPRDSWVHDYGNLDPYPPCGLTPQDVAQVAQEAVAEGRGGLDLEFNPETGKPHILGVASSKRAAACWFEDSLATAYIRDMQAAGGQLVGHAVMDADKPIIDGWLGITTPVGLWDDSLLRGYLCNSDWCSMPGKDEDAADKGSLGFMGLYAMASYYLGLPNWKRCVHGDTRVLLADGREEKISTLVRAKYAGMVKCVVNGKLTDRAVTDWHVSPRGKRQLVQVTRNHAAEFRRCVVTDDHEFLTDRGWVRAKDIRSADLVYFGQSGIASSYWDVVIGCLLGDGHLEKFAPRLHVFNNLEHRDYLDAKLTVLRAALGTGHVVEYDVKLPKRPKSLSHWKSPSLESLRTFRSEWETNPDCWLAAIFTTRTLAILFLDDGYMSKDGAAEICLGLKSPELCAAVEREVRLLGIECKVVRRPSAKVRRLVFSVSESRKLARLIAPYTPESMRYKLGQSADLPAFDSVLWSAELPIPNWDTVTITPAAIDQWSDTVYCLSVDEAENFVVPGGVIHNCRGSACFGPCPRHDEPWYCAVDSWAGLKIADAARKEMGARRISERLYEDLKRLSVYCGKMTRQGIRIDRDVVNRLETGIQEKKGSLFESEMRLRTERCKKLTKQWLTPFNPNAPKQIKDYFDSAGIELRAKKGSLTSKDTIRATLERELKKARVPFVTDKALGLVVIEETWDGELTQPVEYLLRLLEYKTAGKGLKSWFADEYIDAENFAHPRFIVPGTATGRLASSNPNFQNLPKRGFGALVRAALIPRNDKLKFVRADKSQLELRICLHYAGVSQPANDAFSWLVDQAGGKFDAAAARFAMKPRDIAKSVAHAGNYNEGLMVFDDEELRTDRRQAEIREGALLVFDGKNGQAPWYYRDGVVCFSGANLAERLFGEKTRKARRDALAIQEIYFDAFPAIRAWHQELSREVERSRGVRSITGRHMYLYGSPEEDLKLAAAFCGQGGGADEVQEAMLRYDDLGHVASIQVHDELGFEVPREWSEDEILRFFHTFCEPSQRFAGWRFPVEVSQGLNYGAASPENPDGLRKLEKQIKL